MNLYLYLDYFDESTSFSRNRKDFKNDIIYRKFETVVENRAHFEFFLFPSDRHAYGTGFCVTFSTIQAMRLQHAAILAVLLFATNCLLNVAAGTQKE